MKKLLVLPVLNQYYLNYFVIYTKTFNIHQLILIIFHPNNDIKTIYGAIDTIFSIDRSSKLREGKEQRCSSINPPPNTTIFNIFGSLFLPLCTITSPDSEEVRNLAMKSLYCLVCQNHSEIPLPTEYLAHFLRIALSGLISPSYSTIGITIQYTKEIFTLDYRGLFSMIPNYLSQISYILSSTDEFSQKTQIAAVKILGSLLCLPDYYENFEIYVFNMPKKWTMADLKLLIYEEIMKILKFPVSERTLPLIYKGLCYVTIMIYQEQVAKTQKEEIMKGLLDALLRFIKSPDTKLREFSLNLITTLEYVFPMIIKNFPSLIENIYTNVAHNLKELVLSSGEKADLLPSLVDTVIELLQKYEL